MSKRGSTVGDAELMGWISHMMKALTKAANEADKELNHHAGSLWLGRIPVRYDMDELVGWIYGEDEWFWFETATPEEKQEYVK